MADEYEIYWAADQSVNQVLEHMSEAIQSRIRRGWETIGEIKILEEVPIYDDDIKKTVVYPICAYQALRRDVEIKARIEEREKEEDKNKLSYYKLHGLLCTQFEKLGMAVRTRNALFRNLTNDKIKLLAEDEIAMAQFAEDILSDKIELWAMRNIGKVAEGEIRAAMQKYLSQQKDQVAWKEYVEDQYKDS